MRERTGESRPDGGVSEALILACILSVVGMAPLLLWMAVGMMWPGPWTGSRDPVVYGSFLAAVVVVLLLDGIAAVTLRLRLVRSPRAPSLRWVFGPGLIAMLLAMAVAALAIRGHIGANTREIHLPGWEPTVTAAVLLLAYGLIGLLLASLGLLLHRGAQAVRSEVCAEAALLLLCVGGLLLVALETGWFVWVSSIGGSYPPPTGKLGIAPVWFAGLVLAAVAATVLAVLLGRRTSGAPPRHLLRLPLGALLFLCLMGLAASCFGNRPRGLSDPLSGPEFSIEYLKKFFHLSADTATFPTTPSTLCGIAFLVLALFEYVHRVGRRNPDPRLVVALTWIGSMVAGLAVLSATGALGEVAGAVLKHRQNLTPKDLTAGLEVGGELTLAIPILLVAQLLASARPFFPDPGYLRLRRIGLLALTLGALGFVSMSVIWLAGLEAGGPRFDSFQVMRSGVLLLRWGAAAFLICATIAATREFVRQGRLRRKHVAQTRSGVG